MTVESHLATPGDPCVPLLPCRLSHGIQVAAMYVLWSQLATPGDPYVPLLPCRLSHGIHASGCYVRTSVAVCRRVGFLTAIKRIDTVRWRTPVFV